MFSMSPRSLAGIALALVAAALLLAGSLSHHWYERSNKNESIHFGLTGLERCAHDRCERAEWSAFHERKAEQWIEPLSRVALGGTVLVIVMVAAAGGLAIYRRGPALVLGILAAVASLLAAGGAIATILLFHRMTEQRGPHPWHAGWSVMVYIAGAVAGLASGVLVAGGKRRG